MTTKQQNNHGSRISELSLAERVVNGARQLSGSVLNLYHPPGEIHTSRVISNRKTEQCTTITAISSNLRHDWPRQRNLMDRMVNFARLVEAEKPDILLLQELVRKPGMLLDEWLSGRLGMTCVYARESGHIESGFEEGLAVMSRYPLGEPVLKDLSLSRRNLIHNLALCVPVETPCGRVKAVSTRLDMRKAENRRKIYHFSDWVSEITDQDTVLVGGDFRTVQDDPSIRKLRSDWTEIAASNGIPAGGNHNAGQDGVKDLNGNSHIFLKESRTRWQVVKSRMLEYGDDPDSAGFALYTVLTPLNS